MDELDKTPPRPLALWLGTVAPGGHHRSITVIWWFSHQLGLVHPRLPPFAPSTREWSFEPSIACDGLPLTAIHPSLPRGRRAGCPAPFASGWGGTGAAKSIVLVAATSRLEIPALWRPPSRRKGVARERNSHQRLPQKTSDFSCCLCFFHCPSARPTPTCPGRGGVEGCWMCVVTLVMSSIGYVVSLRYPTLSLQPTLPSLLPPTTITSHLILAI